MNVRLRRRVVHVAAVCLALVLPALAAADGHRMTLPAGAGKEAYTAECGSCHLAYPPQLLSATGWNRLMTRLDQHFGVDASLDAKGARAIGGYLAANAGAERRFGTNTLRISETTWFRHEHDEVPDTAWKSPQVRSAANCAACHLGADRGDYSERGVRLPAAARR